MVIIHNVDPSFCIDIHVIIRYYRHDLPNINPRSNLLYRLRRICPTLSALIIIDMEGGFTSVTMIGLYMDPGAFLCFLIFFTISISPSSSTSRSRLGTTASPASTFNSCLTAVPTGVEELDAVGFERDWIGSRVDAGASSSAGIQLRILVAQIQLD